MPDNLTPDGPEWAEFEPRDPNKFYVCDTWPGAVTDGWI